MLFGASTHNIYLPQPCKRGTYREDKEHEGTIYMPYGLVMGWIDRVHYQEKNRICRQTSVFLRILPILFNHMIVSYFLYSCDFVLHVSNTQTVIPHMCNKKLVILCKICLFLIKHQKACVVHWAGIWDIMKIVHNDCCELRNLNLWAPASEYMKMLQLYC